MPATGKRPKPTMAAWVGVRPYCRSGDSANISAFVLFGGVRWTLFISACSSGGKPPASAGAPPPSPVEPDATGTGSVLPPSPPLGSPCDGVVVDVVVDGPGAVGSENGWVVDVVEPCGAVVDVVDGWCSGGAVVVVV